MEDLIMEENKKWKCCLCGHVEEAPELPEDYVCPLCGAGKEYFQEVEEK